jgi:hypothetical protein
VICPYVSEETQDFPTVCKQSCVGTVFLPPPHSSSSFIRPHPHYLPGLDSSILLVNPQIVIDKPDLNSCGVFFGSAKLNMSTKNICSKELAWNYVKIASSAHEGRSHALQCYPCLYNVERPFSARFDQVERVSAKSTCSSSTRLLGWNYVNIAISASERTG